MRKDQTLLFVYNADADLFSSLTDAVHKIVSPGTYNCNLCKLTYGAVSMRTEWKKFIDSLPVSVVFMHRDDFRAQYDGSSDLPAVFVKDKEGVQEFISAAEIDQTDTLEELIDLVKEKL